ncbi:kinase-like domain-containing protein [Astrocystis sublimbata]|nr:kinase-like domain-containing protein [Astrocystis sublimbata]
MNENGALGGKPNNSMHLPARQSSPIRSSSTTDCPCSVEASRDQLLRQILHCSWKDLLCPHRRFVPKDRIRSSLTTDKVKTHLNLFLHDEKLSGALATEIAPEADLRCQCDKVTCTGKRVIFACLLRIGREDCIQFICQSTAELCDSKLPFDAEVLSLLPQEWELFQNAQWQTRCHYLTGLDANSANAIKLDEGAALPLKSKEVIVKDRIGSKPDDQDTIYSQGQVHLIEIHEDHHNLPITQKEKPNLFVLKTFRHPKDREIAEIDFSVELLANRQLPRHERIVPLLTAFEFGGHFYLVFPFADLGDLENLWKNTDVRVENARPHWYSTQWLIKECLGIAEALAQTHQRVLPPNAAERTIGGVSQLHADIKARNILCFQAGDSTAPAGGDGTFEIDEYSPLTKTYCPPERYLKEPVSPNYDVWCLGCLYLEFITWALMGYKGIEKFSDKRMWEHDGPNAPKSRSDTFFKEIQQPQRRWYDMAALRLNLPRTEKVSRSATSTQRYHIKASVTEVGSPLCVYLFVTKLIRMQHIKSLRASCLPHDEFQQVLEIIEGDMLKVEKSKRSTSSQITESLRKLVSQ